MQQALDEPGKRAEYRALIVHDEPAVRQVLAGILTDFCHVTLVATGEEGLLAFTNQRIDVVLAAENLSGTLSCEQFLREIQTLESDLPIFVLTQRASPTRPRGLEPMPCEVVPMRMLSSEAGRMRLVLLLDRAVSERNRQRQVTFQQSRAAPRTSEVHNFFVGTSGPVATLRRQIEHAAASDLNLLITGETGVGKTLIAETVHRLGQSTGPFIVVEPATLPSSLFESELFGYAKGAFTGAVNARVGAFEAAQGGTLFLDEIGDLTAALQVKLLRAVENKAIRRLGDPREIRLNVRVIAATNRDLEGDMAERRFRDDLFQRLNEIRLRIPPLRERPEDVVPLLMHFLREFCRDPYTEPPLSLGAKTLLQQHAWPGNAREVRTLARRLAQGGLPEEITEDVLVPLLPARLDRGSESDLAPEERIYVFKRRVYLEELQKHQFNIRSTARALDIPYPTLRSRLKSLGLLELAKEKRGEFEAPE